VKFRPPGAEQRNSRCPRSDVRATITSHFHPAGELRTPPLPAFATVRPRHAARTSAGTGVEICCEESASPRLPRRRFKRLGQVYSTGPGPAVGRVQLSNPLVAGKPVYVKPGPRNCPEPSGCEPDRLSERSIPSSRPNWPDLRPGPPYFLLRKGEDRVLLGRQTAPQGGLFLRDRRQARPGFEPVIVENVKTNRTRPLRLSRLISRVPCRSCSAGLHRVRGKQEAQSKTRVIEPDGFHDTNTRYPIKACGTERSLRSFTKREER